MPIGAWGSGESRDYYIAFALEPQGEGEELMACRPKVVYTQSGAEVTADGRRIVATWTADDTLSAHRAECRALHQPRRTCGCDSGRAGKPKARGKQMIVLPGKVRRYPFRLATNEVTVRLRSGADLELDMGGHAHGAASPRRAEFAEGKKRSMATYQCPKGHTSTDPDYCSECGACIGQATVASTASSKRKARRKIRIAALHRQGLYQFFASFCQEIFFHR